MIPINKKGIIISGTKHIGWNIYVQDDEIDSGGYLILYSNGKEGYDNWAVDTVELERLFAFFKFVVKWED